MLGEALRQVINTNYTIVNALQVAPDELLFVEADNIQRVSALSGGLALSLNAYTYRTGDTMQLNATLSPLASPTQADAYVVVRLPDGTYLSLQLDGPLPVLVPIARNFVPFTYAAQVARSTFAGVEPGGVYTWFGALTQPGTLNLVGPLWQVQFTVR